MLDKFKHYIKLTDFEIIKLPASVKQYAQKIILFGVFRSLIPCVLAFALKGSQLCLNKGYYILAIVFIMLHFSDRILMSLFTTWEELENDNYSQLVINESTKIIMDVSNTTKSKVFKPENNIIQMVEHSEIINVVRNYINDSWSLYVRLPIAIIQVIILFGMLIANVVIELYSSSLTETIIISSLLLICIVTYFFLSRKRVKVRRSYRKKLKENEIATDILFTDIKATDFISPPDFLYHAERLRNRLDENIQINRVERLKLNKIFIQRSFVASALMIVIMLIKFITAGTFSLDLFVEAIALSSIYSTMLMRITNITVNYENIMDIYINLETLYDSFRNISDVYGEEQKKNWLQTTLEFVTVLKFKVTQDLKGAFELINDNIFTFKPGDTVITYGRTGCGKSTLIRMLTGKISLPQSPILFSNGKSGYLNSVGYQTDKAMVNNYVLNELALTDIYESINIPKMLEILRGLCLHEEILRMVKEENLNLDGLTADEKVIEFLKIRKVKEFSSGQMQRLALAKLLYTLDDTIQLVALDEPFNRLDDTTCARCLEFVHGYVHRKPRILIIATHQIEICRPYASIEIRFTENLAKSILNVQSSN